ncbi:MAG: choice-of-anchor A family protein [Lachnospiraceae bacterium]|nr:choice-of-anchor A family protein [Lachnospiraceae bacterium]MBR5667263.1 choice-of-anchor A family protein [Lachnospiraceae bacterium]
MRESILKKVTVTVLSAVMLVTSALPGAALAKEQSGEGDAAASQTRAALYMSVAGNLNNVISRDITWRLDSKGVEGTHEVTDENRDRLLYGTNKDKEYALGTAGHFSLFGEKVYIDNPQFSDFEGRAAAKQFEVKNGPVHGICIKGAYTDGTLPDDNQPYVAAVICNNDETKSFGRVQGNYSGNHSFIVSNEVTTITAPNQEENYLERIYATPKDGVIDFKKEMEFLKKRSKLFADFASNGTVTDSKAAYGTLILKGEDPRLNIFHLTEEQFERPENTFDIQIPDGSYCIINVSGKDIFWSGQLQNVLSLNGTTLGQNELRNTRVLFNFYEADKVSLGGNSRGSVLAPKADIVDAQSESGGPANGGHNAGQLIGKTVTIQRQTGAYGFQMPASYITEYTPHYLYYTVDDHGKTVLKEMPASMYQLLIGQNAAPMPKKGVQYNAGFYEGETIAADVTSEAFFEAMGDDSSFAIYKTMHELGIDPKFEVYTDGKDWFEAVEGPKLKEANTYKNFTRHDDIALDSLSYTFGKSNVYFIMYPLAKVAVDVRWDDKQNQDAKRPASYNVTLTEKYSDNTSETRETLNTLTGEAVQVKETDSELNKEVTFDYYEGIYTTLVPLFGNQSKGNGTYGAGQQYYDGDKAVFGISYQVPDDYREITKADSRVSFPADGALVDENGVAATYHIVLALKYKATFYFVGTDGTKTEVFKNNYKNYRGLGTFSNIPDLDTTSKMELLGENYLNENYTVVWRDIETGNTYNPGSTYAFDYRDVIFEATVRRTETIENSPWLYSNIIFFRNSHYIPAPSLVDRIKADKTTEKDYWGFNYIQHGNSDYSTAMLESGKYDDEKFLMISFVCGIDRERADYTRIRVSTKGYGAKDPVLYEAKKASVTDFNNGFTNTFSAMPGVNPNGKTIQQLLPSDPYKNDYDGMRIIRLIFPAEAYKNETLYFTVYYEKDGVEYVWAYYPVCIKSNEYWTLR